ncbi:hypothetical protein CAOG_02570 [Capsaspora owczarzaki ATCC 30864]|uniref:Uncharacterized protein n=1 Tax=Capsaspora owczarzaki (strain ATCC 30864) TaxID=595528 RepID=A0A0D2U8N0_CAPO3|nr:hypothetical protein CAOG_02570 [Capsaspora owczarzaki ATCC 30864]KJE91436.1 hypothetical protein CAOG_002570 [Capsaspora owczarzaki ATCC 30864]|eukprot:XP_004349320.1 hypothetical protein CAOG_02570 [Capsaspora owczarzaki ATCC 30864]
MPSRQLTAAVAVLVVLATAASTAFGDAPISFKDPYETIITDYGQSCISHPSHARHGKPTVKDLSSPETTLEFCTPWAGNGCCRPELTRLINSVPDYDAVYDFNWAVCGELSADCATYMKHEACFVECSPYLTPFEDRSFGYYFSSVPVCSSWADRWFDACRNDKTCVDNWYDDNAWDYTPDGWNICKPDSQCTTYADRFGSPKKMLETLWGISFTYSTDESRCYMPFFSGVPNEAPYVKALLDKIQVEDPSVIGTKVKAVDSTEESKLPKAVDFLPIDAPSIGAKTQTPEPGLAGYTRIVVDDIGLTYALDQITGAIDIYPIDRSLGVLTHITFASTDSAALDMDLMEGVLAVTTVPRSSLATWKEDAAQPGSLVFIDIANGFAVLSTVQVGAYPVKVLFTPNGEHVVVANQGPRVSSTLDPDGSVTLVSVRPQRNYTVGIIGPYVPPNLLDCAAAVQQSTHVRTAVWNNETAVDPRVAQFANFSAGMRDIEPIWLSVAIDSANVYVSLQAQNAFGVISIPSGTWTRVVGWGFKDHQEPDMGLDASSSDGINVKNQHLFGLYQPRVVEVFYADGIPHLITANQGDATRNAVDISTITIDNPDFWSNPDGFKASVAGLKVHDTLGVENGNHEFIYTFGGRSVSIWEMDGSLRFDSGDTFERILAWIQPRWFNAVDGASGFDQASSTTGCAPSAVTLGPIGDHLYAFIGFDNCNGIVVFDVTLPHDSHFVRYLPIEDISHVTGLSFFPSVAPTFDTAKLYVTASSGTTATVRVYQVVPTLDQGRLTVPVHESWSMAQPLPTARSDFTASTVGKRVFVTGGCITDNVVTPYGVDQCNQVAGDVNIYDPETNAWVVPGGVMITPRTRHAAAVWRERLYVFGGRPAGDDYGQAFSSAEFYDFELDGWRAIAPLPVALSDAAAVELLDKIYVFGGYDSFYTGSLNRTFVYDPMADTWSELVNAPLNGAFGRGDHSAAVIDGVIYCFGGFSQALGADWGTTEALATMEAFDPFVGHWTPRASMNLARGDAGIAVVDDMLYVMGGEGKDGSDPYTWKYIARNELERYDPARDLWITLAPVPSSRLRCAAASVGEFTYLFGGHNQQKEILYLVEKFNGDIIFGLEEYFEHIQIRASSLHNYVVSATSRESRWVANEAYTNDMTTVNTQLASVQTTSAANNLTITTLQAEIAALQAQLVVLTHSLNAATAQVAQLQSYVDSGNVGADSNAKEIAVAALVLVVLLIVALIVVAVKTWAVPARRRANSQRGPVKLEDLSDRI